MFLKIIFHKLINIIINLCNINVNNLYFIFLISFLYFWYSSIFKTSPYIDLIIDKSVSFMTFCALFWFSCIEYLVDVLEFTFWVVCDTLLVVKDPLAPSLTEEPLITGLFLCSNLPTLYIVLTFPFFYGKIHISSLYILFYI